MKTTNISRRHVWILPILYLIFPCNSVAQISSAQIEKIVTDSRSAIVKIHVTGIAPAGEQIDKEGTGFFVGSDEKRTFLVTAQHLIGSNAVEQSKNADWKVENGRIERKVELSSLDEKNSLVPRIGAVHVLSPGLEGADFAVLMIEQGKFPTLTLGDPLTEKESVHNVILLGFGKGSAELTRPFHIATGQLSGISYVTSLPSRDGESGAPWIDIDSGKVFGVASGVRNLATGTENQSTIGTIIRPALAIYFGGAANAVPAPLDVAKPTIDGAPNQAATHSQDSAPPEFAGLDVIYFHRSLDGAVIKKVLDDNGVIWRPQTGDAKQASNVVTCGSVKGLPAAKKLATWLLDAGVQIRGIAPQRSPISNKLTVEYYPQYSRQPLLTKQVLQATSSCPTWAERLSPIIKVENSCDYGRLDIYLRYFHPFQNRWTTTVRFGLGPEETWVVTDGSEDQVGSGQPYVLIAPVPSTGYVAGDVSELHADTDGGLDMSALDSIPDQYFHKVPPVVRYGCPQ